MTMTRPDPGLLERVACTGCGQVRRHRGLGLCGACYERQRRGGELPLCGWPKGCRRYAVDGDRCGPHARLEDALWLLDCGEPPEQVSTRVGVPLATLAGMLRREGDAVHYPAVVAAYKAERLCSGS